MSITAKLLYIGLKLSGIKKKYTLPESAFLAQVRKMNKKRGFYVPDNKKAIYQTHEVLGHKCLIVQTKEKPAARAILYFFGGGMMLGPDRGDVDVVVRLTNKTGCDMIHISKGDQSGVDHIHFVYSTDEVLYGAKQNFTDACETYGVIHTVRERSGMIHCYAMLPYFKEAKADFDEIARILTA